jgi:hypothetical protein
MAITTNKQLAKKFAETYPRTNYYIQSILVDASNYLKNVGKKTFFGGEDKGDKYIALLFKDMHNLIEEMSNEYVFTEEVQSYSDILEVISILIDRYSTIYPNWVKEYMFIVILLDERKDFLINIYRELLDSIIEYNKYNKSNKSIIYKQEKYTLDNLIFKES